MSKRSRLGRQGFVVLAMGGLVVAAACGSTAPRQASSAASRSGVDVRRASESAEGLDAAIGVSGPVPDAGAAAAARPRAGAAGTRANAATAPAAGGAGGAGSRLPVGPGVRGVTDTAIQVGMWDYDSQAGAATLGAVTGGTYEDTGSPRKRFNAIFDYVNATGGVGGRKLEPVYYFTDYNIWASSVARQSEHQKACSAWTEDNHVFAIAGFATMDAAVIDCAAKAKAPIVMVGYQPPISQSRFDSIADYWYAPDGFVADSRERTVARFLNANGFFAKGAKVGIMIEDTPGIREGVERGLKPTLASAGIRPVAEIVYRDVVESPWPNYVLQLQAAGVTHVVMSATTGGVLPTLFMLRAAEDQQYRPQWGIGSDHQPSGLRELGPEPQFANVWAAGWIPSYDIGDTVAPVSPTDRACREVMVKAGFQDVADSEGLSVCEVVLFLQAAFARSDVLSAAGLAAGVARLADTYVSTMTIGGATRYASRHHEGVTILQLARYDGATKQFRYTTEPQRVTG